MPAIIGLVMLMVALFLHIHTSSLKWKFKYGFHWTVPAWAASIFIGSIGVALILSWLFFT